MSLSNMKLMPTKSSSTPVFVPRGQRNNRPPINSGAPPLYKPMNQTNKDYEFYFVGGCKFYRMCGCNYWPWFKNVKKSKKKK